MTDEAAGITLVDMQRLLKAIGIAVLAVLANRVPADTLPPFRVGETLHYNVYWGILQVGSATLEVKEMTKIGGHPTYHIVGTTVSNSFLSKLYPVHSTVETFLDIDGLFSRKFIENRHEGRYRRERQTTFDYEKGQGTIQTSGKPNSRTFELKGHVQEGFSSIYYLRTQPLEPGHQQTFVSLSSNHTCEVKIEAHEKKNITLGRLGTFPAIRMEPSANYESIFANKGAVSVWVSADERKVPLMMIAKIAFGHIKAVLCGIEGVAEETTSSSPQQSLPLKMTNRSLAQQLSSRPGFR